MNTVKRDSPTSRRWERFTYSLLAIVLQRNLEECLAHGLEAIQDPSAFGDIKNILIIISDVWYERLFFYGEYFA